MSAKVMRYSSLALVTVLSACSWFTDFRQQPKPDPWESANDSIPMRGNPQNSVSVYGTLVAHGVIRPTARGTVVPEGELQNPFSDPVGAQS